MTVIEPSVFRKLCDVLGHSRVYPDEIPMRESDAGDVEPDCALPAVAYRLVSGTQPDSLDKGNLPYKSDSFLIEVFDTNAKSNQDVRTTLFKEFTGPVDKRPGAGGWPKLWVDGGPKIRWAEATDPSVDTDYGTKDAHDLLRFVQLLLTVTYHERVCT